MNEFYIRNVLEAALLAAGKPLQLAEMSQLFDETTRPKAEDIRAALDALANEYSTRGVEVKETAAGFRIQVRREFSGEVSRLWPERPVKYSRALLETLALIAYRQPITRAEIEAVRGVAVNPNIIKTVIERNWVRVVGHRDVPGRPELLGTTREFLDYFGLRSLDELPPLAEIKSLGEYNPQLELPGSGLPALEGPAGAELSGADGVDVGVAGVAVAGLLTNEAASADGASDAVSFGASDAVSSGAASSDESSNNESFPVEAVSDELSSNGLTSGGAPSVTGAQVAEPHEAVAPEALDASAHDAVRTEALDASAHDAVASEGLDASARDAVAGEALDGSAHDADGSAHGAAAGAAFDASAHGPAAVAAIDAAPATSAVMSEATLEGPAAAETSTAAEWSTTSENGAAGRVTALGQHDSEAEAERTLAAGEQSRAHAAAENDDAEASGNVDSSDSLDALDDSSDEEADEDELSADGHGSRELVAGPRDLDE